MKKVVFVINYFYPDYASTGQLLTDLCLELQQDFNITVIAAQPNYAGETLKKNFIFEEDKLEKLKIIRIKLPEVNKNSKISRIKYIFTYFWLAKIALLKEQSVDCIYTISQPPIIGGLIGTIGKLLKRSKHIYNIQDFNPEQAEAIGYTKNRTFTNVARAFDNLNCKYSDAIVLVGNDMINTLRSRFKKNPPYHTVINNWTNEDEIAPLNKNDKNVNSFISENGLDDKFIIMYSGNIGLFYDLENIIKITKEFKDHKDIAFVFIGEGAVKDQILKYTQDNFINNVYFLPYQPKDRLRFSLNSADVHLVVNQKGIKGVSVPSKIYGVMAAGKPILGVLEKGSEAEILISKSQCGWSIEPHNYNEVVKKIKEIYEIPRRDLIDIGINGREYLDKNLRKKTSIDKYRQVINDVLNK